MSTSRINDSMSTNTAPTDQVSLLSQKINSIQEIGNGAYRFARILGPSVFISEVLVQAGMMPLMMRPIQAALPTLIFTTEDIYYFFTQTSAPWHALKTKGVKSILFDVAKFSSSLTLSAGVGIGFGILDLLGARTISNTAIFAILFENSICSTFMVTGISSLFHVVNSLLYRSCNSWCKIVSLNSVLNTENQHINFLQKLFHQLARPISPIFSAAVLREISSLNRVNLDYHAAIFAPLIDQIFNGVNYITATPHPFDKLAKQAQNNFKEPNHPYDAIHDDETLDIRRANSLKWMAVYMGMAIVELSICAAIVELCGMSSNNPQNTTLFYALAYLGMACAILAELGTHFAVSTRKTAKECFAPISNFFGGLFNHRAHTTEINQNQNKPLLSLA